MAFERIDDHLEFDRDRHLFRLDGRPIPSITQALLSAGLIDTTWFNEYARERGSAVHLATAYFDLGVLDAEYLDGPQAGYLEAWDRCCREHDCRWVEGGIEQIVYSIPLQLAGIIDRNGFWEDTPAIVEIKSGELLPSVAIQLQLQSELLSPGPRRRIAVRLFEDGKYEWKEYRDREDRKVALACLTITHWRRRNKK